MIAGYARTPPPPGPETRRRWRRAWARHFFDHVTAAGHVLRPVCLDSGHDVDGFHDVLAYARRGEVTAVLVPGLDHLHAVPASWS